MRLLIVFFCVFCLSAEVFGQEDSLAWIPRIHLVQKSSTFRFPGNYVFASPPNSIIVGQDTIYPPNFGRWLVDSWDAYARECCNDSTLHEWWGPHIESDEYGNAWGYGNFKYSKWLHREATMQGFIEYLRRKLKEGKQ